ncbi:MAG: hypothetical protein M5U22_23430, partial [Thermoleophilia bacterium]|nr:hypothetical protein [Thermoleophilia bacterium]
LRGDRERRPGRREAAPAGRRVREGVQDIAGLDDLREKMRERLRKEAEERSRLRVGEEIRRGLLERNVFEVPKTLVDRQIAVAIQDMANRLASQGVDLKKVSMDFDKMRERFRPRRRAGRPGLPHCWGIAEKENVDVAFSELEAEMKAIAAASGADLRRSGSSTARGAAAPAAGQAPRAEGRIPDRQRQRREEGGAA